jgi:hypothetical protein
VTAVIPIARHVQMSQTLLIVEKNLKTHALKKNKILFGIQ